MHNDKLNTYLSEEDRKNNTKAISFKRLEYLDSMRGIAACMVVFYHFIGWQFPDDNVYYVSSLIFNGSDAVSFFFVLSGFVLSFKYLHSTSTIRLPRYIYKRILRLYPAFILAVLSNYLYWNRELLLSGDYMPIIKDVFVLNEQKLWEELSMVIRRDKFYIPGWTLRVEMILSLIVPLLVFLAKKNIKLIYAFLFLSIVFGYDVFVYSFHFALGVVVAYFYPFLQSYNWKQSKFYKFRFPLLLMTFLAFSIRHIDRMVDFGTSFEHIMKTLHLNFFHFTGMASAIIIAWVINNVKVQNLLTNSFFLFIGKISYGIYLFHWLYVVFVMEKWQSLISFFPNYSVGFICLLILTLFFTFLTSYIVYIFVEKPFIALGRRNRKSYDTI